MKKPICAGCGNDGTQGSIYVTVDARWSHCDQQWVLEFREDDGGGELDCVQCDHRTEEDPAEPFFPYGPLPQEPLEAWRALQGS